MEGTGDRELLESSVSALREADAKYELAFVLTRFALHPLAALPKTGRARVELDELHRLQHS